MRCGVRCGEHCICGGWCPWWTKVLKPIVRGAKRVCEAPYCMKRPQCCRETDRQGRKSIHRFRCMLYRLTFVTGVELCDRSLLLAIGQFTFIIHLVTHPSSWHKMADIKNSEALVRNGKRTVNRWPGHPQHTRYCQLTTPFFPSSSRIKPLLSKPFERSSDYQHHPSDPGLLR